MFHEKKTHFDIKYNQHFTKIQAFTHIPNLIK